MDVITTTDDSMVFDMASTSCVENNTPNNNKSLTTTDVVTMSIVMEDLENRYATMKYDHDNLTLQLDKERANNIELNHKLIKHGEYQNQIVTLTHETQMSSNKIQFLTKEKLLKEDIINKKQVEVDMLREELRYVLYCRLLGSLSFVTQIIFVHFCVFFFPLRFFL